MLSNSGLFWTADKRVSEEIAASFSAGGSAAVLCENNNYLTFKVKQSGKIM